MRIAGESVRSTWLAWGVLSTVTCQSGPDRSGNLSKSQMMNSSTMKGP